MNYLHAAGVFQALAALFCVVGQGLDIATSEMGVGRLGFTETNTLLRNKDKQFVLWKGLVLKGMVCAGVILPTLSNHTAWLSGAGIIVGSVGLFAATMNYRKLKSSK